MECNLYVHFFVKLLQSFFLFHSFISLGVGDTSTFVSTDLTHLKRRPGIFLPSYIYFVYFKTVPLIPTSITVINFTTINKITL